MSLATPVPLEVFDTQLKTKFVGRWTPEAEIGDRRS